MSLLLFLKHVRILSLPYSVIAQDNLNVSSPEMEIVIVYCSGCSDNPDVCNYTVFRTNADGAVDDRFRLATCDCPVQFIGNKLNKCKR